MASTRFDFAAHNGTAIYAKCAAYLFPGVALIGYPRLTMRREELLEREANPVATIGKKLPDFAEYALRTWIW